MKKLLSNSLFRLTTLLAGIAVFSAGAAAQQLTLTQDGINLGFTLTTFATLEPTLTGCCGPLGVAIAAPDRVLVMDYAAQTRYVFHDADNQTKQTAITSSTQYPSGSAYATAGGHAYGGVQGQNGGFCEYNVDGTVNHFLTGVQQAPSLGMWANPTNGHLLATTAQGTIIDIDPLANNGNGSARTVVNAAGDGVAVSPDGTIVYNEISSHIYGFNIATGAVVFDSGFLSNGPDGTGVISSNNNLNGMLIVNFNGNGINTGGVVLLNPTNNQVTVIATGGTRGDYAAADVTNGTLFLDYSDKVYRLSCGANCSIGQGIGPCSLPIPQCQAQGD
jgi:hypothetical protein